MPTQISHTRSMQVYSGQEVPPQDLAELLDGMPTGHTITLTVDPDVDDKITITVEWIEPRRPDPAPPVAQCPRHIPLCIERGEHQPPCHCVLPLGHDAPCTSVKW